MASEWDTLKAQEGTTPQQLLALALPPIVPPQILSAGPIPQNAPLNKIPFSSHVPPTRNLSNMFNVGPFFSAAVRAFIGSLPTLPGNVMPTLERAYAPQQVLDSMPRWAGASAWLKAVTQPPLDAVAQILHACYRDVLALPAPEEGGEPETASTPAASQWKFDVHLADYPFDETQGFTTLAWSSNKVVDVDTDPDLARVNGMRLDVDVRCFIFVFSPWMMNTLDFKNFILQRSISSRPRPRGTEQVELTQSDKIWAVINDRCARFNCDYFIITTVDEWAFGCFSQERTTAFITHTIRSSSTGPAGLEPDSSVSVMEAATFWLASSLGAPGGWEIDQVSVPLFLDNSAGTDSDTTTDGRIYSEWRRLQRMTRRRLDVFRTAGSGAAEQEQGDWVGFSASGAVLAPVRTSALPRRAHEDATVSTRLEPRLPPPATAASSSSLPSRNLRASSLATRSIFHPYTRSSSPPVSSNNSFTPPRSRPSASNPRRRRPAPLEGPPPINPIVSRFAEREHRQSRANPLRLTHGLPSSPLRNNINDAPSPIELSTPTPTPLSRESSPAGYSDSSDDTNVSRVAVSQAAVSGGVRPETRTEGYVRAQVAFGPAVLPPDTTARRRQRLRPEDAQAQARAERSGSASRAPTPIAQPELLSSPTLAPPLPIAVPVARNAIIAPTLAPAAVIQPPTETQPRTISLEMIHDLFSRAMDSARADGKMIPYGPPTYQQLRSFAQKALPAIAAAEARAQAEATPRPSTPTQSRSTSSSRNVRSDPSSPRPTAPFPRSRLSQVTTAPQMRAIANSPASSPRRAPPVTPPRTPLRTFATSPPSSRRLRSSSRSTSPRSSSSGRSPSPQKSPSTSPPPPSESESESAVTRKRKREDDEEACDTMSQRDEEVDELDQQQPVAQPAEPARTLPFRMAGDLIGVVRYLTRML